MSVSVGLLDFYILEAGEYVDQLDAVVGAAASGPPDSGPFVTAARALRGSSTMAKLLRMAELAGSVERVGRGLRAGSVRWTPELRSAIVAAIDDLRILLRNVRAWGAEEERRAAGRIDELRRLLPDSVSPPSTPVGGATSTAFFASEVEAVATALDAFVAAPSDRRALDEALGRVRALRGISALKDLPPLADVADALEHAAKTSFGAGSTMTPEHGALFTAATHVLRRGARELRTTGRPDASAPEVQAFADAAAALQERDREVEVVVPVSSLFFTDGGPNVVSRAERPPTTAQQRFRAEVVSHAEHLRRLVADARAAGTVAGRDHAVRELRTELRAIRASIESFAMPDVARFFGDAASDANLADPVSLSSVDAAASMLATTPLSAAELTSRLKALARGRTVDRAIATGFVPLDRPRAPAPQPSAPGVKPSPRPSPGIADVAAPRAPGATPPVARASSPSGPPRPRPNRPTPTGVELHQFLQTGIAGLDALQATPLAEPAPIDDATLVPIDELVYRGPAALRRAIELREEIRSAGGVTDEALAELFDLLDLAAAD